MMTTAMAGIDLPRYVTTEIRIDNRKRRPTQEEDMDDNGYYFVVTDIWCL